MGVRRRFVQSCIQLLLFFLFCFGIPACNELKQPNTEPFPDVAALPSPQLPDWIEQISPTGQVEPLAQIRIRFQEPLIPLEQLEAPEQQKLLQKIELYPPLPGQFRFLTPRMVGFAAEQALPKATRMRVTLKAGLADLQQHRLEKDLAWTFQTEPVKITQLPGQSDPDTPADESGARIGTKPTLPFAANVELDLRSLQKHLTLKPDGSQQVVAFNAALDKDKTNTKDASPETTFDPSQKTWHYTLNPVGELERGKRYRLEFTPGLRSQRGNLPSEITFSSQVNTYGSLSFQKLAFGGEPDAGGAYGRFMKGRALLQFNNGLVADTARKFITVSPPPKEAPPLVQVEEGDRTVTLNPWALESRTAYTITIAAGLKDKFGQILEKPVTIQYETGDVAPDIWAPSNLNIFPTGKDLQLNLTAVNLPENRYKATYRVIQPEDLVYRESAYPQYDGNDLLPAPKTWSAFKILNPKRNETSEIAVPLREKLGSATGMLAYGVQARTNSYEANGKQEWREPSFYGLVQLTNLGVFAQWFPDRGMVRVHQLASGAPVKGATVEVFASQLTAQSRPKPNPCAIGKTDATGMLVLKRSQFQACLTGENASASEPPQFLIVAREGQDWAFTRILRYSGAYGYGVDAGWNGTKPESRGIIFSDRQLYQPGEKGWFTGVAYYLQKGTLLQDKDTPYTVTLEGPNGKKTKLGTQTTNRFGTFSLEVPFAADQPLGYYTLRAQGAGGKEITGEFQVAEFKPPNFKVELSLKQKFAQIGETLDLKAQSNYLFGAPVEGGEAKFYVTRKFTTFTPKDWEQFSFGRRWFWPEQQPEVPTDVLQTTQSLTPQGESSQPVKIAADLPYPMTYRLDVQVRDVSNLTVADSLDITALPDTRLIGLKTDFVAEANQPFPVEVIVADPNGKAIAGQSIQLELQRMDYSSITQVVEGSQTPHDQVQYKTVAKVGVRSNSEPVSVSLTPPESGSYRIRANFAGASNDVTATDAQIWASGTNSTFWGDRYRNERLEVKLDKEQYRPGETATALIQSPYPEGELYFAVIRNNVLYQTVQPVKGSAPKVQFQITPEMLPNAAVEAVLVRSGVPLANAEPGSLKNLVRVGFAPFNLDLQSQFLNLQVTPQEIESSKQFRQPGEQQSIQLALTDQQGKAVQGQFTVMVVNEAILQLSDYRVPDLVKTVYAAQPISTRFADNRPEVVLDPLSSPLEKGWGYGGGSSLGAASTRVRTDFRPLAYYNGSLITDTNGKATFTFQLPDDLTTWRVMAVATDGNLRFGKGDATFLTSKPLVTNPVLPQFVRPGDRFEAGLSVTNNTGQVGDLAIQGQFTVKDAAQNSPLVFAEQNKETPNQRLQTTVQSTTTAYRFPMLAKTPGESRIQFQTGLLKETDVFAVPLIVKPYAVTEQVIESGSTPNQVKIPLKIEQTVDSQTGGLEISLASTLIPEIKAPAQAVLQEAQLPFLEPAVSQLEIAANLQQLSTTYGQTFAEFQPKQQAIQALARLQKLQRLDGGFATWPGQEKSDPMMTPYAATAIARAGEVFKTAPELAALQPDTPLVQSLKRYLKAILADPKRSADCQETLCQHQVRLEVLLALDALGERRNEFLSDLYEQREQLGTVAQMKLARYLFLFPEWKVEASNLTRKLEQIVYQTGRNATVNLPQQWHWLESSSLAQAQAIQLFTIQPAPDDLRDRLLQGLLSQRRQGTWGSSYNNAAALNALVAYSRSQPPPPQMSATARLKQKTLLSARFAGYQTPSATVNIPPTALPKGRHDLLLNKTGQGRLHYFTTYRYQPKGNPPGRLNGLRVTRQIRSANQTEILQSFGLSTAKAPLEVKTGDVFDVGLEIITDHPIDHVVMTDHLPAGFEAIDTRFQTATQYFQPLSESWQIDYQTLYRDRITAYSDRLEAGVYTLHYLVRAVTPGTFSWPGAEAHLQYAPEEFGRSTAAQLKIRG
jgi:alpha-2-macroglobulin